jgi:hypothetical protein
MGYASTPGYFLCYSASDDVVVVDAPEAYTYETTYTKIKEIVLVGTISTHSLFRFKQEVRTDNGFAGLMYVAKNGVIIGSVWSGDTGAAWVPVTEDIISNSWNVGDKVQIYAKTLSGAHAIGVKNFSLCGAGSEWEIKL